MKESSKNSSSDYQKRKQESIFQIDKKISEYEVPFTLSAEEALAKVRARLANKTHLEIPDSRIRTRLIWTSLAAASFALLVTVWFYWVRNPEVRVIAQKGEHQLITLPDGSTVVLNAEGELSYRKKDYNKTRQLSLKGEAFFNIVKGKEFSVETAHGKINVLGTTFNVLTRSERFKVSCLTGKVQVQTDKISSILGPGESCVKENNKLRKFADRSINSIAKWRDGEFYFEDTPLKIVFEELARQYNIIFVGDSFEGRLFTGSFGIQNLTDALDVICIPMGLSYDIDSNGKVYIRQKKK